MGSQGPACGSCGPDIWTTEGLHSPGGQWTASSVVEDGDRNPGRFTIKDRGAERSMPADSHGDGVLEGSPVERPASVQSIGIGAIC